MRIAKPKPPLPGHVGPAVYNAWSPKLQQRFNDRYGAPPRGATPATGVTAPGQGGGKQTNPLINAPRRIGRATHSQYSRWDEDMKRRYRRRHGRPPPRGARYEAAKAYAVNNAGASAAWATGQAIT